MRFIRVVIAGLAGALMSMAAIAAPVEQAPVAIHLSSPSVEVVASVPQPNFETTFHLAASANHATASASVERTPGHALLLSRDPDYNSPSLSLASLSLDPSAGTTFLTGLDPEGDDDSDADSKRLALRDPEEGGGEQEDAAA